MTRVVDRITAIVVVGVILPVYAASGQVKDAPNARAFEQTARPRAYEARGLAFSPDVTLLATTSGTQKKAGCVVLYDLATHRPRWVAPQEAGVASAAYSPDKTTVAVGMYSGPIKLLDAATGQTRATLAGHTSVVWRVAYSGDGQTLASGSWDGSILLWDMKTNAQKPTHFMRPERVESLAFSSDGKLVAGGGASPTVSVWDGQTGKEMYQLQGHPESNVLGVAFTADKKFVTTGALDGTVTFWDAVTGKEWLKLYLQVEGVIHELRLANDQKSLAVLSRETHEIQIYDFDMHRVPPSPEQRQQVNQLLTRLADNDAQTRDQAMHDLAKLGPVAEPELRKASSSNDVEVRMRARLAYKEMCSPKPRVVLKGLTEAIYNMTYSPDSKFVAGASSDGTVCVWKVADGALAAAVRPAEEE